MKRLIDWFRGNRVEEWLYEKTVSPVPAFGPYVAEEYQDGVDDVWEIRDRDDKTVAVYAYWDQYDGRSDQIGANFRLLAAAPELLDAMESLMAALARSPWSWLNGSLVRAMEKGQDLLYRLFGTEGEKDFRRWQCELFEVRPHEPGTVGAGRSMTKSPTEDFSVTVHMGEDSRPWVRGQIREFTYHALVLQEHASNPSVELKQSRISKLELRNDSGQVVFNWDWGLDIDAASLDVQQAVDWLCTNLAKHVN